MLTDRSEARTARGSSEIFSFLWNVIRYQSLKYIYHFLVISAVLPEFSLSSEFLPVSCDISLILQVLSVYCEVTGSRSEKNFSAPNSNFTHKKYGTQ